MFFKQSAARAVRMKGAITVTVPLMFRLLHSLLVLKEATIPAYGTPRVVVTSKCWQRFEVLKHASRLAIRKELRARAFTSA
jgi:hypothetical protein